MPALPQPTDQCTPRELAVLVHGLCSSRAWMWPLAVRLRRRGLDVRQWSYFTLAGSNREMGRRLAEQLRRLEAEGRWPRIHLVAHSMGSIVARCALREALPESLGRVVMIGPPNGGSHMATRLRYVYGFCRPMIELMDHPDSFVNRLPPPPEHVEFGVLAAERDNVIHLDKTHLAGERDHRVVRSWHTGVLWRRDTADYVGSFLRYGHFGEPAVETARPARCPAEATS